MSKRNSFTAILRKSFNFGKKRKEGVEIDHSSSADSFDNTQMEAVTAAKEDTALEEAPRVVPEDMSERSAEKAASEESEKTDTGGEEVTTIEKAVETNRSPAKPPKPCKNLLKSYSNIDEESKAMMEGVSMESTGFARECDLSTKLDLEEKSSAHMEVDQKLHEVVLPSVKTSSTEIVQKISSLSDTREDASKGGIMKADNKLGVLIEEKVAVDQLLAPSVTSAAATESELVASQAPSMIPLLSRQPSTSSKDMTPVIPVILAPSILSSSGDKRASIEEAFRQREALGEKKNNEIFKSRSNEGRSALLVGEIRSNNSTSSYASAGTSSASSTHSTISTKSPNESNAASSPIVFSSPTEAVFSHKGENVIGAFPTSNNRREELNEPTLPPALPSVITTDMESPSGLKKRKKVVTPPPSPMEAQANRGVLTSPKHARVAAADSVASTDFALPSPLEILASSLPSAEAKESTSPPTSSFVHFLSLFVLAVMFLLASYAHVSHPNSQVSRMQNFGAIPASSPATDLIPPHISTQLKATDASKTYPVVSVPPERNNQGVVEQKEKSGLGPLKESPPSPIKSDFKSKVASKHSFPGRKVIDAFANLFRREKDVLMG